MKDLQQIREEKLQELIASGDIVENCSQCKVFIHYYRNIYDPQSNRCWGPHAPSHVPSHRCESGKRPHCTCDTCF